MCHSENRYGDKQNKNRWDLQTVSTTWKIYAATNRIKTLGDRKQWPHLENICGDKHKNSWLANCVTWKMNVATNSKLMSITLHISYSHKNELKCGLAF